MDTNLATLDCTASNEQDHALALTHAPLIRFDAAEPFLPSAVGYTVFRTNAESPSFPRRIEIGAGCVIEYAIWWDWDIGHLYELEHIWVHLDANGNMVDAEASWHGGFNRMVDQNGNIPLENGRLVVYSEPGKHAFAPSEQRLLERRPTTLHGCTTGSGRMGVHVTRLFKGRILTRTPNNNQLAHTFLERHAFIPTYAFSKRFPLESARFTPWDNLNAWIPQRVAWWLGELDRTIPYVERRALHIAHLDAPAQSPEALKAAADSGADMVKVDVRITADGQPTIVHDEESQASDPPMTFDALVEQCRDLGLGLYLDIKALAAPTGQHLFTTLDKYGLAHYAIWASSHADWLADIKTARPDVFTAISFEATDLDVIALAQSAHADYVHPCWEHQAEQPHTLLTPDWLERVRAAGLGIITWNAKRPAEIEALQQLGVSGICSNAIT